jgi:hypothetical protein
MLVECVAGRTEALPGGVRGTGEQRRAEQFVSEYGGETDGVHSARGLL